LLDSQVNDAPNTDHQICIKLKISNKLLKANNNMYQDCVPSAGSHAHPITHANLSHAYTFHTHMQKL